MFYSTILKIKRGIKHMTSANFLQMKNRIGKAYRVSAMTLSVLLALLFVACNATKDDYYDRPDWLEAPVYDILKAKGNFTLYLQCVDKTPYAKVLKGAGNYTVFAPNDSAFRAFLNGKSVDVISETELKKIVGYTLVFNKFDAEHLGDKLISTLWSSGGVMRRMTSYYKTIYKEDLTNIIADGAPNTWVVDYSKNKVGIYTPYRYVPILTDKYFDVNGLGNGSADYAAFYPATPYNNLQVANAGVVTKNMYAENGVIHEVNAVPYPLKNLDEMLKEQNDGYAEMKSLFETSSNGTPYFVTYTEDKLLTEQYKKIYPDSNITTLFTKSYTGLPYILNNESYASVNNASLSDEQNGYTLVVPHKSAIDNYFNTRILNRSFNIGATKYDGYTKKSDLPKDVVKDFLQSHMLDELVWPSGYHLALNSNSEFFNGKGSTGNKFADAGIDASHLAGNGILYQTKDVIKSKYFETVFSQILLNPNFSMMNTAMKNFYLNTLMDDLLKSPISGYAEENYTIILPTDDQLKADGFLYDQVANTFSHSYTTDAEGRLKRLIRMGIFRRVNQPNGGVNTSITDFTASQIASTLYGGYGYAVNEYGDVIKYKGNQVQGVGNQLENSLVNLTQVGDLNTFNNGTVFVGDKLLQYSKRSTGSYADETLYQFIVRFVKTTGQGKAFLSYLERSLLTSGKITGVAEGDFYTIIIPADYPVFTTLSSPMNQAKNSKFNTVGVVLPDTLGVVASDAAAMKTAGEFIQSCFLQGYVLPDDGLKYITPFSPANTSQLKIPTMMRANNPSTDLINEKTYMTVYKNTDGTMTFVPNDIVVGDKILVHGGVGTSTEKDPKTGLPLVQSVNRTRLNANTPYYSNFIGPRAVIHLVNNYHWFKIK
jgi:Secreted and surface protein containing fasciclin-like repeats